MGNQQTHKINRGDTRTPIGAILKQGEPGAETVVDLTGLTVQFRLFDNDGNAVMDWQSASVVSPATAGKVSYDFQSSDVDTAGTYWGYFRIVDSGEYDTFPIGRELRVIINSVS